MLAARVIPCLDVSNGRVVKGIRFQGLRDAGDPVECAAAYESQGGDEIVVLPSNRTATIAEGVRPTMRFASWPMARICFETRSMATTEGSLRTMPRPLT